VSRAVSSITAHLLGRVGYHEAHALQERLVDARVEGRIGDTLLLLEHPPVLTLGRGAKRENVLFSFDHLRSLGVEVVETGRGGDVTYHGPGQLVGYPIIDLKPDRQDVRKYVSSLEETMIRMAAEHGLEAERVAGLNGAWIGDRKIGAVGVRIRKWVTMHGFAINGTTDLSHFQWIVPCGIQGRGVTSIELETGEVPSYESMAERAANIFADLYEASLVITREPPALREING
jgi:lipoyl(octanoyl) transferase